MSIRLRLPKSGLYVLRLFSGQDEEGSSSARTSHNVLFSYLIEVRSS